MTIIIIRIDVTLLCFPIRADTVTAIWMPAKQAETIRREFRRILRETNEEEEEDWNARTTMYRFNVNGKRFMCIIFGCFGVSESDSHQRLAAAKHDDSNNNDGGRVRARLCFSHMAWRLLLPFECLTLVNSTQHCFSSKYQLDRVKLTHHNLCNKWSTPTILIENEAPAAMAWWGSIVCLRKTFSQHLIEFVLIWSAEYICAGTWSTSVFANVNASARAHTMPPKCSDDDDYDYFCRFCFFIDFFFFFFSLLFLVRCGSAQ